MGEVYLAEDTKLDRKVALKTLPQEFAEDKDRMNRIGRDAMKKFLDATRNVISVGHTMRHTKMG